MPTPRGVLRSVGGAAGTGPPAGAQPAAAGTAGWTWDLYAQPGSNPFWTATDDGLPMPPALLWGIAWRLLLLELTAPALLGDLAPGELPRGVLPLVAVALAAWGIPARLWSRWDAAGAVWRVLTAAVAVATLSTVRPLLPVALAGAGMLCLAEPVAQRRRRRRLSREDAAGAEAADLGPEPVAGGPS